MTTMRVLRKGDGETWEACLTRLSEASPYETDAREVLAAYFDLVNINGETESEAAWIAAEGFGLLDEIKHTMGADFDECEVPF